MRLGWLAVSTVLVMAGCATLSPRLQGDTAGLTWQATDLVQDVRRAELAQDRNPVQGRTQDVWYYAFNLLIREARGVGVTFNEIDLTVYQPGTIPWSARYPGQWRLEAQEQFRIPLVSSLSCHYVGGSCAGPTVAIPLWRVKLNGTDDRGQPVNAVIDVALPSEATAVLPVSSKGVRAITLVPGGR